MSFLSKVGTLLVVSVSSDYQVELCAARRLHHVTR